PAPPSPAVPPPLTGEELDPARFGRRGQLVLAGTFLEGQRAQRGTPPFFDDTYFIVGTTLDVFLAERLSIGLGLRFNREVDRLQGLVFGPGNNEFKATYTSLSASGRVGYDVSLAKNVSIWPGVQVGVLHASQVASNGTGGSGITSLPVALFAPILFHPVHHFFLGLGPNFNFELWTHSSTPGDARRETSYGIESILGGYL
ncbi:MAG: hypothetical protein JWM82_2537, partial [Myxococcales bacterium]|nr:hypothetical protein [Myxococcales bacterium]